MSGQRRSRRRRRDVWAVPALLVVAAAVLTAIGLVMRAHERVLDVRGVIGLAMVVEAEGGPKRFERW